VRIPRKLITSRSQVNSHKQIKKKEITLKRKGKKNKLEILQSVTTDSK